jgi:hypothetical protein
MSTVHASIQVEEQAARGPDGRVSVAQVTNGSRSGVLVLHQHLTTSPNRYDGDGR